jgi:hypothetical protein
LSNALWQVASGDDGQPPPHVPRSATVTSVSSLTSGLMSGTPAMPQLPESHSPPLAQSVPAFVPSRHRPRMSPSVTQYSASRSSCHRSTPCRRCRSCAGSSRCRISARGLGGVQHDRDPGLQIGGQRAGEERHRLDVVQPGPELAEDVDVVLVDVGLPLAVAEEHRVGARTADLVVGPVEALIAVAVELHASAPVVHRLMSFATTNSLASGFRPRSAIVTFEPQSSSVV